MSKSVFVRANLAVYACVIHCQYQYSLLYVNECAFVCKVKIKLLADLWNKWEDFESTGEIKVECD